MSWISEVEELNLRRQKALQLGGEARVDRHHQQGKLTIRERIDELLDAGSFTEVGQVTGDAQYEDGRFKDIVPAPYVMGMGKINGRWTAVGGEDFTVRGGSSAGLARRKGGRIGTP